MKIAILNRIKLSPHFHPKSIPFSWFKVPQEAVAPPGCTPAHAPHLGTYYLGLKSGHLHFYGAKMTKFHLSKNANFSTQFSGVILLIKFFFP